MRQHDPIVLVREGRGRRGEGAAVRGEQEGRVVLLDDAWVQRPDVSDHALVVVVIEAEVVHLALDGDAAVSVDPIEDRLDAVERVLPLDVILAVEGNREAHFDGPAERRRQREVIDRSGRDPHQDDEEGDPDRQHFSPTSRRGGRRLRLTWFRHLSTTRPCLIAGRRSVLRQDQSAIRFLLDPTPWNSQGGLSYFGVHVGSVWAVASAAARRFAHSPIGVGSTAVPIITAMAIGRRSPVTPFVTPYCAMMREISARGIRNAARGQTASARTPAPVGGSGGRGRISRRRRRPRRRGTGGGRRGASRV